MALQIDSGFNSPMSSGQTTPSGAQTPQNESANSEIIKGILDCFQQEFSKQFVQKNSQAARCYRAMLAMIQSNEKKPEIQSIKSMVDSLSIPDGNCSDTTIYYTGIIQTILPDDASINWGRIASCFIFSKMYLEHCLREHYSCDIDELKRELAKTLSKRIGFWIEQNGGWEQLINVFQTPTKAADGIKVLIGVGALALATMFFR